ncbi:MAG: hypothetical protein KDC92_15425 [Bacteroidetes bacterium]|nr:hypothetical protein [Bacteroidota bacterium]
MKLMRGPFSLLFFFFSNGILAQQQIKIERSYKVLPETNERVINYEKHYTPSGELVKELTFLIIGNMVIT